MIPHIHDIRAIRLFVSFVIPYADFITNYAFGRMTLILTGYFLASPNGGHRITRVRLNIKEWAAFQP